MSVQIEDESFKYAGYWKATAEEVIQGDGVRFSAHEPGVIVHEVSRTASGQVVFLVSDRAAHVSSLFADAFKRPIEGMAADPAPAVKVMAPTQTVWVRM